MKSWAVLGACAMALSGCVETAVTAPNSMPLAEKPAVSQGVTIRNNAEFRSALKKIKADCGAKYRSNLQGVSVLGQFIGGSGGNLVNQAAVSSIKSSYEKCMSQYRALEAAGTAKGLTFTDPKPKPKPVPRYTPTATKPSNSSGNYTPRGETLLDYWNRQQAEKCANPYFKAIGC